MLLSKEGVNMEVKVYAKGRTNNYEAYGIFDGKGLVVKKGSRVSEKIAANVNPIVLKKEKSVCLQIILQRKMFHSGVHQLLRLLFLETFQMGSEYGKLRKV